MFDMTDFYTYLHCKPNGDPFYVGKGHGRRSHEFRRRNPHHQAVLDKYKPENIRVFVFPCESEEQAFADEIQQIAQPKKSGFILVNYTDGGEGSSGCALSDETKLKLSLANKGKKMSAESSRKKSVALKGCKMPPRSDEMKVSAAAKQQGKRMSSEARAKMSAARMGNKHLLGHVHTDITRKKMSDAHKGNRAALGFKHTDETKSKMSAARKGKTPWNKGVPKSKEVIEKTRASLLKFYAKQQTC